MRISGIIIALLVLITAAVSGCLSGDEPPDEKQVTGGTAEQRENSEAGVTIVAVYLGDNAFNINLDTHSGSLDYEMDKVAFIRDSKGNIIKPEVWDGGIGGHHFSGTLRFPEFDDSAGFELVIQDVADVKERIFRW
ncbi:hypothetical protein ANME2D_00830 [Candidatus Methanoperedens nitroreducens]|uniref:DUF4352 domain-containing protein n=1 Tax=Candidatus Methanoperedens nitratireducens TaxID=1392998 RepID=A0A062V775_9EURY|nr:hypothetical protein [Candidatus Methanoperedens nitroreducens]KCZ72403.1 hypothetical protein ANME2D_00830 [Candidatus Methanoperedens nitroreducens]MDJ1423663.1 hypothetical protein [Candidatus Methanoperedens sp.]